MRGNRILSAGILFVIALLLVTLPGSLSAQEETAAEGTGLVEGETTQGDFAFWLIKAIQPQLQGLTPPQHAGVAPSVNFLLNPAANADDAIKFLTDQLVLVPEGGWQKDEALTSEALASLLEKPEDGQGLSFDELVEKVLNRVQEKFQTLGQKKGVFRIFSSTPSVPAV